MNANSDVIAPKMLVVPIISGASIAQPIMSGALFISGSSLYFVAGSVIQLVTSA